MPNINPTIDVVYVCPGCKSEIAINDKCGRSQGGFMEIYTHNRIICMVCGGDMKLEIRKTTYSPKTEIIKEQTNDQNK